MPDVVLRTRGGSHVRQPERSRHGRRAEVLVRCDQPWGGPIDSPFVIVYAQGTNILGEKRLGSGWWIIAKDAAKTSYIPPQRGTSEPVWLYQDSPGDYHTSDGVFVTCTSAPARFASTPFLLQSAGDFLYVTPEGRTHNGWSLDDFL